MEELKAGVIGCGGRGRGHARGYAASKDVVVVACADPIRESREAYVEHFGVERSYADYQEMLDKEDLDIVSVCTWTGMHREIIEAVVASSVKVIQSEKPMAPTWGDAKAIMKACNDNDVVITFCHQRRFGAPFVKAKQLVKEGAIGKLTRVEGACPNLFDWGTHWFDMFFFYNDDVPAEWVIGQIDGEGTRDIFDVPCEGSGLSWIRFQNGLEGLLATGGVKFEGPKNRLIGTHGTIEIQVSKEMPIRLMRKGASDWEFPDLAGVAAHSDATICSVLDLVDAIRCNREPELSGRKALAATELIFATYESSRRRGKVTLPLDVDDSALIAMLADGSITRE